MKKTIFVTGAAGFIGFHAAKALTERGDLVIGLDNFNDYYPSALKRKRADLLKKMGVNVIQGDINDHEILRKYIPTCSDVLHLAAQAGVRYSKTNPQAYLESNIQGFLSLLEALRNYPEVELTFASSSSVYGKNAKIPFSILDMTDQPANLYAVTKKANELMAYSYHHLYGICSKGLRYFTVYGPWGRPDMAYFSFTKAILSGQPIHLFNGGKMQRDFTYIDDIVKGTLAALDYRGTCEIFNLGNHCPVSLLDFVALLEKLLGRVANKVMEGPAPGEVEVTYADITESQQKLGFQPQTSIEKGLSQFVDWYIHNA